MSELHAALVAGTPPELFAALRAFLAALLLEADGRTAPALSKELRAVLEAQQKVKPVEVSSVDDLAAARASRLAAAKAADRTG